MAETRRLTRLRSDLLGRTRLPPGDLLVALSGGPDSTALLAVVVETGRTVRAVHVDHGQRHSARAVAAAAETARRLGVEVAVVRALVPEGSGFEQRARTARYDLLVGCASASEWILTGHTLDDLAETVLMRMARGSGLDGLAGIPEFRPPVGRPFLRVRRGETRELATLAGLPFFDDPTNADERFLRNRVRRRLLPELVATFGADPSSRLASSALELQAERAFLDRLIEDVDVTVSDRWVAVELGALEALDPVLARRLVRRMWQSLGFEHPLEAEPVGRALAVARGSRRAGQLGGGVGAIVRDGRLVLERGSVPDHEVTLSAGVTRFDRFKIEAVSMTGPVEHPLSPWELAIPTSEARTRLTMRWAGPGDRLGRLEVADLLAGAGLESSDRWPVVALGGRIVWIPGVRRAGWERRSETGYLSLIASEESVWGTSTR